MLGDGLRGCVASFTVVFLVYFALLTAAQPMQTASTDSSSYEPGGEVRLLVKDSAFAPVGVEVRGLGDEIVEAKRLC